MISSDDNIPVYKRLNSKYIWATFLFGLALIIRIIYFIQIKSHFIGWDIPVMDAQFHDVWAREIAAGKIIGTEPFFRAPFYAYFLGLIYAIFGHSILIAKIIQHAIGALSCALVFLFADKFFGRRIAVISGLLASTYWIFMFFEDDLLLDSLLVPLTILSIWILLKAVSSSGLKWFVAAGLILGIACITRPTLLAVVPVVIIWMLIVFKSFNFLLIKRIGTLIIGLSIPILPITAYNYIVGTDFILISSQGGLNFYIGNNSESDGFSATVPEFGVAWTLSDCEYLAKSESNKLAEKMKQSEISSFFYRKGFNFIQNNFTDWVKLMAKKFYLFWSPHEILDNQNVSFYRQFSSIIKVLPNPLFIVLPLSIIGLLFIFRLDVKYHIIAYFVIAYMLAVIAFFINSRFRLPIMPLLMILSVFSISKLIELWKSRDYKNFVKYSLIMIIVISIININIYGKPQQSPANSYFSLGNLYFKKGLYAKALKEYDTAIQLNDCVPCAHLNKGIIYCQQGQFSLAKQEFELEIAKCNKSAAAYNNLSVLDRKAGDFKSSVNNAEAAIVMNPYFFTAYISKIIGLISLKEDDSALIVADSLVYNFPEYNIGHYYRGKLLFDRGRYDEAFIELHRFLSNDNLQNTSDEYNASNIYTSYLDDATESTGIQGIANFLLGLIETMRGANDSALSCFIKASELYPSYSDIWINLGVSYDRRRDFTNAINAYKRAAAIDTLNPYLFYNMGITFKNLNELGEAKASLKRALILDPNFRDAAKRIEMIDSIINQPNK